MNELEGLVIPNINGFIVENPLKAYDEQRIHRFYLDEFRNYASNELEALMQKALETVKAENRWAVNSVRGKLFAALKMYDELLVRGWNRLSKEVHKQHSSFTKAETDKMLEESIEDGCSPILDDKYNDKWDGIVSRAQSKVEKAFDSLDISLEHEEGIVTVICDTSQLSYRLTESFYDRSRTFEVSLGYAFVSGLQFAEYSKPAPMNNVPSFEEIQKIVGDPLKLPLSEPFMLGFQSGWFNGRKMLEKENAEFRKSYLKETKELREQLGLANKTIDEFNHLYDGSTINTQREYIQRLEAMIEKALFYRVLPQKEVEHLNVHDDVLELFNDKLSLFIQFHKGEGGLSLLKSFQRAGIKPTNQDILEGREVKGA
jgi:hypothetical protein